MPINHPQVQKLIKRIAQDNRSGATSLTQMAADLFKKFTWLADPDAELTALQEKAIQLGVKLVKAKPIMGSIFNLSNTVIGECRQAGSPGDLIESIRNTADQFSLDLSKSTRLIVKRTSSYIPDKSQIMTISYSSTVLEALKKANQEGKTFKVICPESRPIREGVELAATLADLGIPATVVADCLAPTLLKETELILAGGDGLTYQGLVNKAGTYMLAKTSRQTDTPMIALLSTHKFMPVKKISRLIPEEDPSEIMANPPPGVEVINRYFDITPLELVDQVITEEGVFSSQKLAHRLDEMKIDERLKPAL